MYDICFRVGNLDDTAWEIDRWINSGLNDATISMRDGDVYVWFTSPGDEHSVERLKGKVRKAFSHHKNPTIEVSQKIKLQPS